MATTGAVYMELSSSETNRLIAASVSSEVAAAVEIHETATMDAGDDTAMSDDAMEEDASDEPMEDEHMEGAMTMRQVTDGLMLPAGEALSLAPGGYHLMLLDLADPLESGETFDVTLEFEDGQTTIVSVAVQQDEP